MMPRIYKRKSNRHTYNEEDLQKAIANIAEGASIQKMARLHGISAKTLRCHRDSKVQRPVSVTLGHFQPDMDSVYDKEIIDHIQKMGDTQFPLTTKDVCRLAYEFAVKLGIQHHFNVHKEMAGIDWLESFIVRHPQLSIQKAEALNNSRSIGLKLQVEDFFKAYKEVLEAVSCSPVQIWNANELSCIETPPKMKATKEEQEFDKEGKNVTVVCAVNAVGKYIPPMFIFPRECMVDTLMDDAPVGSTATCTESGGTDAECFLEWLEHFVSIVKSSPQQKHILVLDNHSSHETIPVRKYAHSNGIEMVTIPSNCSNKLQPLNQKFFKHLKSAYISAAEGWMIQNHSKEVSFCEVARIFTVAYNEIATVDRSVDAFRECGLWPYNDCVFNDEEFVIVGPMENTVGMVCSFQPQVAPVNDDDLTLGTGQSLMFEVKEEKLDVGEGNLPSEVFCEQWQSHDLTSENVIFVKEEKLETNNLEGKKSDGVEPEVDICGTEPPDLADSEISESRDIKPEVDISVKEESFEQMDLGLTKDTEMCGEEECSNFKGEKAAVESSMRLVIHPSAPSDREGALSFPNLGLDTEEEEEEIITPPEKQSDELRRENVIFLKEEILESPDFEESESCSKSVAENKLDPESCPPTEENTTKLSFKVITKLSSKVITKKKRHECSECSYSTNHKRCLTEHFRIHTGERPFKCNLCSYSASHKMYLVCHLRIHSGEKPYKCNECSYSASSRAAITSHLKRHNREKPHKCDECSFSASSKAGLTNHLKFHMGEKPYKCRKCPYACSFKELLTCHLRTHSKESAFKCDKCSYSALTKAALTTHSKIHSDFNQRLSLHSDKRFKCDECPYTTSHKTDLTRHLYQHNGGRGLKGNELESTTMDLNENSNLHEEEHYECKHCSFTALHKVELEKHVRRCSAEQRYPCPECSYSAPHPSRLEEHLKKHTGEKPYMCAECPFRSASLASVRKHVKHHFEKQSFQCPMCSYSSSSDSGMTRHLNLHGSFIEGL